jgi:hypothetical protein
LSVYAYDLKKYTMLAPTHELRCGWSIGCNGLSRRVSWLPYPAEQTHSSAVAW